MPHAALRFSSLAQRTSVLIEISDNMFILELQVAHFIAKILNLNFLSTNPFRMMTYLLVTLVDAILKADDRFGSGLAFSFKLIDTIFKLLDCIRETSNSITFLRELFLKLKTRAI